MLIGQGPSALRTGAIRLHAPSAAKHNIALLEACKAWLDELASKVASQSLLGKAIAYTRAYFGERDRRFRERDRFGEVGRCAVLIVELDDPPIYDRGWRADRLTRTSLSADRLSCGESRDIAEHIDASTIHAGSSRESPPGTSR
jgi:hypothetical protein